MMIWISCFVLMINISLAEIGKVNKIVGPADAYILRNQNKIMVAPNTEIEEGDEIFSLESVLVIHLYPTTQMSLAKNTQIKISKNLIEETADKEKSFSIIEFVKGIVRLQVTKDDDLEIEQQVVADGVAFAVRGTEFEVSNENENFDLDVIEGEVEVSSPYVQTFVPEIVKANEGFRFNKKQRNFQKRKFGTKFKNHPGFAGREEIKAKRKQMRAERKQKRLNNKDLRQGKKAKDERRQKKERPKR